MLEKMKEIIADQLSVDADSITEASSFKEDLGADSLDLFELVMALEDEYSVEIPSDDLQNLLTVGDVMNYLKEKGKNLKIEIEVRNFNELEEAMRVGGIDRIMLDNFNIEDTKEAVRRVNGRYEIESSGGITFDTLRDYAECGVDYISVGALTHSVKSLDMSLKACE